MRPVSAPLLSPSSNCLVGGTYSVYVTHVTSGHRVGVISVYLAWHRKPPFLTVRNPGLPLRPPNYRPDMAYGGEVSFLNPGPQISFTWVLSEGDEGVGAPGASGPWRCGARSNAQRASGDGGGRLGCGSGLRLSFLYLWVGALRR
jgi:hypothetical protein